MKSNKSKKDDKLELFQEIKSNRGIEEYKERKIEKAKKAIEFGYNGNNQSFDMSFIEKEKVEKNKQIQFFCFLLFVYYSS